MSCLFILYLDLRILLSFPTRRSSDLEDEARERQSLESAINVVDGIVLAGTRLSDATLNHLTKRIPVVVANRRVAGLDSVTTEYAPGMGQALALLAQTGARTIPSITGTEHN